jgi:type VI secretion system protein ImpK
MTVETVVRTISKKAERTDLLPRKYAQKQWIVQIKNIRHSPEAGINPLADAAAIFFTTITELRQQQDSSPSKSLQQRLIKELNSYQQHVQKKSYTDEIVLASRYCLCATADEIISNTSWGGNHYWEEHRLLAKLHQDSTQGKRFFAILQRIQKEPEKFIDLIELMYFCINLGFKGKYRNTLYGASQLNMRMESIYHQIRQVRGETTNNLSPRLKPLTAAPRKQKESLLHNSLITIGVTVFIIAIITSSFSYLFKLTSKQIFDNNAIHSSVSVTNDENGSQ